MRTISILPLAASLLLAGCVSVVAVKKVGVDSKDSTPGLRYFLPQVFLQVTPTADGNITVEKLYMPDRLHQYAIKADSYLSSHTLEVERDEKGLLKSVTFNSDSTAVAQQALTSAAALRAAQIDQKSTKDKAAADQAKADADKAKTALDTADAARKAAATALDVAQRKLALLQQIQNEPKPPNDIVSLIVDARLAVEDAQAKKDAADTAYNAVLDKTRTFNTKAGNAGQLESWPQALEPVFYKVVMEPADVKLVQAFEQSKRATFVVPKTDEAPKLAVYPASVVVRPAGKAGALTKTVHLTLAAKAVDSASFVSVATNKAYEKMPVLSLALDMTTIDVEVPKDYSAGDYDLDISITPAKPDGAKAVTRTLKIRVEK